MCAEYNSPFYISLFWKFVDTVPQKSADPFVDILSTTFTIMPQVTNELSIELAKYYK